MSRTKGTFSLTSNIEPKFGAPLDARTIVKLKTDLTASGTFDYPYIGLTVFVEEENKKYTLIGSDPTVSTNWIEDNSGGHTIKNPAGTAMTQRSNLQFVDLTISDDSTNDATKVESVHVIQSESELENLPDGLYMLNDDEDTVIDGNLVGYDNTNSSLNAENVQDAIDEVVEALDDKIDISAKGVANGVAELDSTGKVPSSQLPSFVDDVIEVADYDHLPTTGETGKIYVTLDTNKTYRWGGTEYVEISESLALGETSSTAYRGDRGKAAYDHSQLTSGNPHNVTKSEVGLGNVDNTSDSTKKTNFTGSIASGNTGFTTGGDVYTALSAKADKVTSATNGNLAGLDGNGNLTDSGVAASEILDKVDWVSNGILGAKNLIPYPYENTSGERQGVTFTVNADGSVSLSGTASATNDVTFTLLTVNDDRFSGYVMTGGKSSTIYMRQRITDKNGTYKRASVDKGSGVALDTIDASTEKYTIAIWVTKGINVDNITIYPMLRLAADTDTIYRPYAKTNKQLTDEVADIESNKLDKSVFDALGLSVVNGKLCQTYNN